MKTHKKKQQQKNGNINFQSSDLKRIKRKRKYIDI